MVSEKHEPISDLALGPKMKRSDERLYVAYINNVMMTNNSFFCPAKKKKIK